MDESTKEDIKDIVIMVIIVITCPIWLTLWGLQTLCFAIYCFPDFIRVVLTRRRITNLPFKNLLPRFKRRRE